MIPIDPQLPPEHRDRRFHTLLMLTDLIGRASPWALAPLLAGIAFFGSWPWSGVRVCVFVVSGVVIVADSIGMAWLPRAHRSFGPVGPPLLSLAMVRGSLAFALGHLHSAVISRGGQGGFVLALAIGIQLTISALSLYGMWIEPFRVGITRAALRSDKLTGHKPIRILHLTDLHVERLCARELEVARLVRQLAPDVVILTGDYLNLSYIHDARAQADARDLMGSICDACGGHVYAVTGSPPVDVPSVVPDIFRGLPITWLMEQSQRVQVNGGTLNLVGLTCTRRRDVDGQRLRSLLDGAEAACFTLLLYHSPDLMPDATDLGIDLYLCGHTHGGQIRAPLFGAIFTSSDFGKRYEMGRYTEGQTTLYVSRGVGMEGLGAPRARFLSPPEVVLWTLSG